MSQPHYQSTMPQRLIIATCNPGKLPELRALLAGLPFEVSDAGDMPDVEETGATFEENACLKAVAAAGYHGAWALGDDSGIEVDALGGEPGVYSARFAGPGATDEQRNDVLLARLETTPDEARTARYRAVVAVASPEGEVRIFEGVCEGLILRERRGAGGFGYDPLFFVPKYGVTMAELPPDTKNQISHRGRALAQARRFLEEQAATGQP